MTKIQIPPRVADYFVVIGSAGHTLDRAGTTGSSKARAVSVAVSDKPSVLQRFPDHDHADAEFPKDIPIVRDLCCTRRA